MLISNPAGFFATKYAFIFVQIYYNKSHKSRKQIKFEKNRLFVVFLREGREKTNSMLDQGFEIVVLTKKLMRFWKNR